MTAPLGFDELQAILRRYVERLPDHRQPGPNTRYRISDAALGAFGIFFTQSPSFLEYQRHLQRAKGQNNAATLFGVDQIPTNNQIRNLLDPIAPSHLDGVYLDVFEQLDEMGLLRPFRVLDNQLLLAMDGTQYFSSSAIHCAHCLHRQSSNGQMRYYHSAVTPVLVCPGRSEVVALPPEFIRPQDGQVKQDCERVAGKRWIARHAKAVAPRGITLLGDDLYSNQPFCELALHHGFNFILVCKPESHTTLYDRLEFWQSNAAMQAYEHRHFNGRFKEITQCRYLNNVLLKSGQDALSVNWLEMTTINAKTGEQLYYNSWITNHPLSEGNVVQIGQAGRGRWKVENENNNVLKTKGYHIEHNFGHGKKYLSSLMLSLNLLAFLFHTVMAWTDAKYGVLREALVRRETFFDDVRALTRYMIFESWPHLMDFMIRGLELESELKSEPGFQADTS